MFVRSAESIEKIPICLRNIPLPAEASARERLGADTNTGRGRCIAGIAVAPLFRMAQPRVVVAVGLLALALTASTAPAQYFGGNKVQHRTFAFQVLKTEHFDVYFYPEEREAAGRAGRMAERWYARLSQILGEKLSTVQPLVLYASHADFEQTNIIEGTLGEGTGGVTEMLKRRIVLPLAPTMAESDHVIGHELVHAFQYDLADRIGRGERGGSRGIEQRVEFMPGL